MHLSEHDPLAQVETSEHVRPIAVRASSMTGFFVQAQRERRAAVEPVMERLAAGEDGEEKPKAVLPRPRLTVL